MVSGRTAEQVIVYNAMKKRGYGSWTMHIPTKHANHMCFKNKQKLNIEVTPDMRIIISPEIKDRPHTSKFIEMALERAKKQQERVDEKELEKKAKYNMGRNTPKKGKIEIGEEIRIQREIGIINNHIRELEDIIVKDRKLLSLKESELELKKSMKTTEVNR